jgi:SpoVK/Ycf46/Vps4 family AAA+-type ATPase
MLLGDAAIDETLLKRLSTSHTWQEVRASQPVTNKLKAIAENLCAGKGGVALFTGPAGTGKTLSAQVLANELSRDLYRVDLSAVVSKYIGETEKNLHRIFEQAQASNAILFFDEADALFGKRTDVKDAHDRYANLETGYLLQRIEEYPGLVILTSNLSDAFDDAFTQRVAWVVDFPQPRPTQRLSIWQKVLKWLGL